MDNPQVCFDEHRIIGLLNDLSQRIGALEDSVQSRLVVLETSVVELRDSLSDVEGAQDATQVEVVTNREFGHLLERFNSLERRLDEMRGAPDETEEYETDKNAGERENERGQNPEQVTLPDMSYSAISNLQGDYQEFNHVCRIVNSYQRSFTGRLAHMRDQHGYPIPGFPETAEELYSLTDDRIEELLWYLQLATDGDRDNRLATLRVGIGLDPDILEDDGVSSGMSD